MSRERNMDKIVTGSDSQLVVNFVKGLIKVPSQINNHVLDIVNLARHFVNIQFSYCNMSQNSLVDRIVKGVIVLIKLPIYINELFFSKNILFKLIN